KPSISRRNRIHWHYVRDDALFSTIKVVSRHQTTQQYGTILPIELTTAEIRNNKAYKEYHACAMGEATPKPKASARKKKGDSASSTTPPTPTPTTTIESAPWLSATAKGKQHSRATTPVEPIDVQRTEDKGTGKGGDEVRESKGESDEEETREKEDENFDPIPGTPEERVESIFTTTSSLIVSLETPTPIMTPFTITTITTSGKAPIPPPTIPSIILENLPTFNSAFRFEERLRSLETSFSEYSDVDDDDQDEAEKDDDDDDEDDDEEEIAKLDEQEDTESGEGDAEETESDEESVEEETREEEEESFDPIPRTPEDSEDDSNGEEDQGLRVSEEQRLIKEEEAAELYCDVDINQGRGLQVSQDIEDSHVTLTPVQPDGQQESSSVSSFVTSMLNPISDAGVKSILRLLHLR
nr:hypothetical protein [Tanacetum cinerariifolium]